MSIAARQALVAHPNTIFRSDTQRRDLLDPQKTKSELIALLWDLIHAGAILLFCAIRTDHHDDSALGEHSHANGHDADVWFLRSTNATDYLDATDPKFAALLGVAKRSPWLYQIGLAGSADTHANRLAAGPTVFEDSGADHVHLGAI